MALSRSPLVVSSLNQWFVWVLALALSAGFMPADGHAQVPTYLIPKKALWKYSADGSQPPQDWKETGFNDDRWKTAPAGFGYGDADDETVLEDMRNRYTAVYIRKRFDFDRVDAVDSLYLYVNYDDGFIAYLNGKEVASAGVHQRCQRHAASTSMKATGYELFVIRNATALLVRPGRPTFWRSKATMPHEKAAIFRSIHSWRPGRSNAFTAADYLADIDELERRLLDQSSYLTRLDFDYRKALNGAATFNQRSDPARAFRRRRPQAGDADRRLPRQRSIRRRACRRAGSCHFARPILTMAWSRSRINETNYSTRDCPYLASIDGQPLQRWLDAAARYVARGSPQLIQRRSLEWLGDSRDCSARSLKRPASEIGHHRTAIGGRRPGMP